MWKDVQVWALSYRRCSDDDFYSFLSQPYKCCLQKNTHTNACTDVQFQRTSKSLQAHAWLWTRLRTAVMGHEMSLLKMQMWSGPSAHPFFMVLCFLQNKVHISYCGFQVSHLAIPLSLSLPHTVPSLPCITISLVTQGSCQYLHSPCSASSLQMPGFWLKLFFHCTLSHLRPTSFSKLRPPQL